MSSTTLNKSQKTQVQSVISATGASETQAVKLLRESGWSVDAAANRFFDLGMAPEGEATGSGGGGAGGKSNEGTSGSGSGGGIPAALSRIPAASRTKIEKEFRRFQDPEDATKMSDDAILKFAEELAIDPYSDPVILVIAYKFGAKKQGGFSDIEFISGMYNLRCDDVKALKTKMETLRAELKNNAFFSGFWAWAYDYSCEEGQKSLSLDIVKPLTTMLLPVSRWALVNDWVEWLGTQEKTVSKDTWVIVLDLATKVKPDLSNYDDESSWPTQFDDFVEWMQAGKKKKGGKK